ncbi:pimeloyl-ACP methyl ester carboxylesterase [Microbacterium resistens]|uniref:Pimeloyl-ACP methyl ester carboxylesterase n=1 Tax=Microbacterium resistens TaxID=156977 RepID=A0ABU1SFF7_9MICO|nr:alpha/beta hydrolase [Microbacterium resistens]MDR6868321.1 pimeloyl-ACP methyl ester carboxylesterase [Microbacterium resistens]
MVVSVVLVHGIRTSATMWRSQLDFLAERGNPAVAVDLPGHGSRRDETFTLAEAFRTIDEAVRDAAARGQVLLVGHSMGGLLSTAYVGAKPQPPVDAFLGASCTALPRGAGLAAYRLLAGAMNSLPDRGVWLSEQVLAATLPPETREDFGAGGYAMAMQDTALRSLGTLDLLQAVRSLRVPTWFVNGQFDQLRTHERTFTALAPHAELIVVPRATHLVTAMYPRVFNAVLNLALTTVESAPGLSAQGLSERGRIGRGRPAS